MTGVRRWALILLLLLTSREAAAQSAMPPSASDLRMRLGRLAPVQQDEVLWLARCIYSESDRPHEQYLVAWVVRNRVETAYRGTSYRDVVLEPRQFSAFNEPSARRTHILGLTPYSLSRTWRRALEIALDVHQAPADQRPFHITTRHFYSPVSMEGRRTPHWAQNETPLPASSLGIDPHRFQFFTGIDEGEGAPVQAVSRVSPAPPAEIPSATLAPTRSRLRNRSRSRRFSGRVKRPVRPHLDRRGKRQG